MPDRVVVVTGARGGIGTAIVDAFTALGDTVIGLDLLDGFDVTDPQACVDAAGAHRGRARGGRRAVQQRRHRGRRRRRHLHARGMATRLRRERVRRGQHEPGVPPGDAGRRHGRGREHLLGRRVRGARRPSGLRRVEGRGARAHEGDGRRRDRPRHPRQLRLARHRLEPVGRAAGAVDPGSRRHGGRRCGGGNRSGGWWRARRWPRPSCTSRRRRRSPPAPTSCSTAPSPGCGSSRERAAPGRVGRRSDVRPPLRGAR